MTKAIQYASRLIAFGWNSNNKINKNFERLFGNY